MTEIEITPFRRCLIHALVDTADIDKIIGWLKGFGWGDYSVHPEMVERAIQELRDEILRVEEAEDD